MMNNFLSDPFSVALLILGVTLFTASCFWYNKASNIAISINKRLLNSKLKNTESLGRFVGLIISFGIMFGATWVLFALVGLKII